jgi:hypothetical protein
MKPFLFLFHHFQFRAKWKTLLCCILCRTLLSSDHLKRDRTLRYYSRRHNPLKLMMAYKLGTCYNQSIILSDRPTRSIRGRHSAFAICYQGSSGLSFLVLSILVLSKLSLLSSPSTTPVYSWVLSFYRSVRTEISRELYLYVPILSGCSVHTVPGAVVVSHCDMVCAQSYRSYPVLCVPAIGCHMYSSWLVAALVGSY